MRARQIVLLVLIVLIPWLIWQGYKSLMMPTCWGTMMAAIREGDAKQVQYWLDNGVDPNMAFGTSPLQEAKDTGHPDIVRLLKKAGAK